jgi:hypothetical protein
MQTTNLLFPFKKPGATYCEILNSKEVFAAGICAGRERTVPVPVAQLRVTLEDFDADYFSWSGRQFVSEKLRQIMALDSAAVRFFEVDASHSAPLSRSKNYQMMEIAAIENVADLHKSDYVMRRRSPELPLTPDVRRYAFLPDAAPRHELFCDGFFRDLYCTDAFALRILRSGCIGMAFWDPNNPQEGQFLIRTLRGIEELVEWNAAKSVEITKVVQALD